MTNIKVSIPRAIKKYMTQPYDQPIINLNTINSEMGTKSEMKYTINGTGEYLKVDSRTGGIFFTPTFFSHIDKIGTIPISVHVADTANSDNDNTILQVSVSPLEDLDCDEFMEEICFWSDITYKIERSKIGTSVGPLSPTRLMEMCPFKINYTIETDSLAFVIPPHDEQNFWSIGLNSKVKKSKKLNLSVHLSCNVETISGNERGNRRKIEKDIQIVLFDNDSHLPVPQTKEILIELQQRNFKKGDIIHHPSLIFTDDDPAVANHFKATVIDGNDKSFLKPDCLEIEFTRENKTRTAIHCKLEFKQDMEFKTSLYSFTLNLNDTSFNKKGVDSTVEVPVQLTFKESAESLTMLKLYPVTSKIFRTAGPLARVAQPNTNNKNNSNFELREISKFKGIFGITKTEGIVFVHDYLKLRNVTTQFLSLNVSWTKGGKMDFDEFQVRIVREPNQTCGNIKREKDWGLCSEYETLGDCLREDSCAIGTGGSSSVEMRKGPERCMWRGDEITTNSTHLYSTCTPDTKNCPDGECDSLEQLHPSLCPQDCTDKVDWPLRLAKTGLGVDEASGTVVCTNLGCTVIKSRRSISKKKKEEKPKKHIKDLIVVSKEKIIQNENITRGAFASSECDLVCMAGIGAGTLFIICSGLFIIICWKVRKTKKSSRNLQEKDSQELTAPLSLPNSRNGLGEQPLSFHFQMGSVNDTEFMNNILNKYEPDPKWEFPRSQLVIEQTLGEGEFGKVLRAKAQNITGKPGCTTVAVKTLKDDARESELSDLLSEYQLLKEVNHPNVIRLLGVCTSAGGPVYLIIEYAEFGSLRNYLRRTRHVQQHSNLNKFCKQEIEYHYDEPKVSDVTPKDLLSFAWQICNGMHYLSDMKLVHRDLAARNVLLCEEKVCKVSDFGLTRDVYEDNAYLKRSKGRVPVKWMAPESLSDHMYTTKSDVWSFGILIWELVTLGATPYPGIPVQNLFHLLRQGYRMERPDNCSPGLYKIMRSCWNIDPEQRPSFLELSVWFAKLLEDKMEYINLSNNAIYNKGYFVSPFEEEEEENNLNEDSSGGSHISPLNYLSKTESYEKCDVRAKEINEELEKIAETLNTQGYETPVKVARKVKTPSNENPVEYTDMGGK